MLFLQPIDDHLLEQRRKIEHPLRIDLQNSSGSLIIADISLFAEYFQFGNQTRVCSNCQSEGFNCPKVMGFARGPISRCRQSRCRGQEGRIIGNGQAPIRTQARGFTITQISFGDGQEVGYPAPVRPVRDEPSALLPIG
jgi:hypothetical protein